MTVAVAHKVGPTGRLALEHGVREARLRGTDLAVVHIVTEALDADRAEGYRLGISDEIERAVGAHADLAWDLHLRTAVSDPSASVLELVRTLAPEVLVIGARKRSPVGKALLGSVAQDLILEATSPVLVVKTG
jgi:nucleotide-binding universal stress UspA family protein